MHSRCGLIEVDLVMEPPAQPYPGYSGGSCSVILASGHHGLAQTAGKISLRTARLFLGRSQKNEYVKRASTAEGGIGRAMGCANALKRRVWQRA